ncbi:MAG TPA: carboxypeptidase regulatory-like domain-containing protein [Candidatus Eisenbacteria bacterium]|jgi:plastocyanin|nr:carboxypeptidase regulatory-like domain-containing protein [Candidatus Eisenbacteria bacterium]
MRHHVIVTFVLLLLATSSEAATIRGVVRVPGSGSGSSSPGPSNPYPGRASSMRASAVKRGAVTDAVVSIAGPAPGPWQGLANDPSASALRGGRLAQKNQGFVPRVLPVTVGARVDFPNQDPIYHNVFSVSPPKRFDLGKFGQGKSKSLVFDKAGLVNVYCDIHSNMEAFIVVLPNAWFAQPDAEGKFTLPPLPAGTYTVRVWHPDLGDQTASVTVGENETRDVELSLAP